MPPSPAAPPPAAPVAPTGSANAASPSPSLVNFDSAFSDMDDAPSPEPSPAPSPTPEPAPEPAPTPTEPKPSTTAPKDPTTGKFTKPADKPAAAPAKPVDKPTPDEFTPPSVATGSQLRKFAEQAGAKARHASSEVAQLRAEVQKLKATPQADSSALAQQLAQANQRIQQYETEARLIRYERSDEYRSKYEAPYQQAVKQAYGDVKELLVTEPNPNDPDNPREREATPADFDEIYNLPLGPASRLAKQKFGDQAGIVLQHRNAIKNAAKACLDAIEANKGNATKYEQEQTAAQQMRQEASSQMFSTVIQDLQTKYPEWFGERDGDSEWNEARAKGLQIADMAFDGEERAKLTPQQNAVLDGQVHLRCAAFAPLKMENTKLRAENKRLTDELAQIRGSGPGKPAPSGTAPAGSKAKDSLAGFDEQFGAD